jgi:hypothetical protein
MTILNSKCINLVDKTKTAFFSPLLGNLISFEYESTTPEANFVIVVAVA